MTPVRDNHHLVQRPTEPEMPEQRTETTGAAVEHIPQLATKQDLESLVAAIKEEMGTLRGDIERFQGATRTDIELLREELDKRIDNFGPKIERVQSMLKQKVDALDKHVDSELRIIRLIVGAVFLGVLMTILKLFIP